MRAPLAVAGQKEVVGEPWSWAEVAKQGWPVAKGELPTLFAIYKCTRIILRSFVH